jgi:hypothetical protein
MPIVCWFWDPFDCKKRTQVREVLVLQLSVACLLFSRNEAPLSAISWLFPIIITWPCKIIVCSYELPDMSISQLPTCNQNAYKCVRQIVADKQLLGLCTS